MFFLGARAVGPAVFQGRWLLVEWRLLDLTFFFFVFLFMNITKRFYRVYKFGARCRMLWARGKRPWLGRLRKPTIAAAAASFKGDAREPLAARQLWSIGGAPSTHCSGLGCAAGEL